MSSRKETNQRLKAQFTGKLVDVYNSSIAPECVDFANEHPERELPAVLPNKVIRKQNQDKNK